MPPPFHPAITTFQVQPGRMIQFQKLQRTEIVFLVLQQITGGCKIKTALNACNAVPTLSNLPKDVAFTGVVLRNVFRSSAETTVAQRAAS